MSRLLNWLRTNVDGALALTIAVIIGAIAVMDPLSNQIELEPAVIDGAVLLVLALLATTLLRDRRIATKAVRDATAVHLLYGPE
ncbi:hypothetical protein ACFWF3_34735, partial [Nocardia sp. NPDC060220]